MVSTAFASCAFFERIAYFSLSCTGFVRDCKRSALCGSTVVEQHSLKGGICRLRTANNRACQLDPYTGCPLFEAKRMIKGVGTIARQRDPILQQRRPVQSFIVQPHAAARPSLSPCASSKRSARIARDGVHSLSHQDSGREPQPESPVARPWLRRRNLDAGACPSGSSSRHACHSLQTPSCVAAVNIRLLSTKPPSCQRDLFGPANSPFDDTAAGWIVRRPGPSRSGAVGISTAQRSRYSMRHRTLLASRLRRAISWRVRALFSSSRRRLSSLTQFAHAYPCPRVGKQPHGGRSSAHRR